MRHTITLIIISVLCLSCRGVLFDQDTSLAVSFISKCDHKATVGPIYHIDQCFDSERSSIFFIPDKGYYNQGFIVLNNDIHCDIWYLDGTGSIYGPISFEISDTNSKEPNYLFETLNGYPQHLFCVNYDGVDTRYNVAVFDSYSYYINWYYYGGDQYISSTILGDFNTTFTYSPSINGVYISPVDDRLYILCLNSDVPGINRYFEVNYAISYGTDIMDPQPSVLSEYVTLNDAIYHDLYYSLDITRNRSLISYQAGKSFKTYTWQNEPIHQKVPINDPGNHLLSSGEIFSYQYGIARGFTIAGSELFVAGKGDVRFCYEHYDGNGHYQSLFTYTTVKKEAYNCSIDSVTFYVYSIQSDKMADIN